MLSESFDVQFNFELKRKSHKLFDDFSEFIKKIKFHILWVRSNIDTQIFANNSVYLKFNFVRLTL